MYPRILLSAAQPFQPALIVLALRYLGRTCALHGCFVAILSFEFEFFLYESCGVPHLYRTDFVQFALARFDE
jgi:hypothetical protein